MKKISRNNIIILFSLISIFFLIMGIFTLPQNNKKVNADPLGVNAVMKDGMALSLGGDYSGKVSVYLPQFTYNQLTTSRTVNGKEVYDYYLMLVRTTNVDFINDFASYYSSNENTSEGKLYIENLGKYYNLVDTTKFDYLIYNKDSSTSKYSSYNFIDESYDVDLYDRVAIGCPFAIDLDNLDTEYYYFTALFKYNEGDFWSDYFSDYFTYVSKTIDYTKRSVSTVAQRAQADTSKEWTSEEIKRFQFLQGINVETENTTVTVKYKEYNENTGFIEDKIEQCTVNSLFFGDNITCYNEAIKVLNKEHLQDFNCVRYEGVYVGEKYNFNATGGKIIKQARRFDFDFSSDRTTGTLNVVYDDFKYSDLDIKISDNNVTDHVDGIYHLHFTEYSSIDTTNKGTVQNPYITLYMSYQNMQEMIYNGANWYCLNNLSKNDFNLQSYPNGANMTGIDVTFDNDGISVGFLSSMEDKLQNVVINGTANIIEDYNVTVELKCKTLNYEGGVFSKVDHTLKTENIYYSTYLKTYSVSSWVEENYLEEIENQFEIDGLEHITYGSYNGVLGTREVNGEKVSFIVEVQYQYNTLLAITSNLKPKYTFYNLNDIDGTIYKLEDFEYEIPDNYKITQIISSDNEKFKVGFNNEKPFESDLALFSSKNTGDIFTLTLGLVEKSQTDVDSDNEQDVEPSLPVIVEPDNPNPPSFDDTKENPKPVKPTKPFNVLLGVIGGLLGIYCVFIVVSVIFIRRK